MSRATIRFLNWIDYIDPSIYARFEAETGIHVDEVLYRSEDECVDRVTSGEPVDVVMADDLSAARLRRAGLLQPLDMERLPNFAQVRNERLRRPLFDPETDGHKYTSVMYFGSEGFMARLDQVGHVDSSWEVLFDPAFAGRVVMIDGAREILSVALYLLGGDTNTTDPVLLGRAADMLVEQRRLVHAYDAVRPWQRIAEGMGLVHCWDGDVARALEEGVTQVRYMLPKEGFTMWLDAPCVPAAASDQASAHRLLDFLLEPEIAAACANYSGYQPVVDAASPLVRSVVQRSLRLSELQIEYGTFHDDLSEFSDVYEAAYARVRAA